jgi:hypothetical protein
LDNLKGTENVKKIVKEAVASVTNAATGFRIAKGWIPAVKEKHISVKYKDQRYALEVSIMQSLEGESRSESTRN